MEKRSTRLKATSRVDARAAGLLFTDCCHRRLGECDVTFLLGRQISESVPPPLLLSRPSHLCLLLLPLYLISLSSGVLWQPPQGADRKLS